MLLLFFGYIAVVVITELIPNMRRLAQNDYVDFDVIGPKLIGTPSFDLNDRPVFSS
jgi:hypothetical protein